MSAIGLGMRCRPSAYDPRRNFEAADNRRRYVIGRMLDDGHITQEIYDREIDLPPVIQRHPDLENFGIAGHFTEEVRRLLFERLEGDLVLNAGLRIDTTLDVELQRAASDAVREGLIAHDRRRGYRGPVRQIDLAAEGALGAELERLARENEGEYTQTEVLPAVSADAPVAVAVEVAEADEAPAKPEPQIAYSMDEGSKLLGIVVEVAAEAKVARIELGRGIVGVVSLDDVDWAKKPDPKKRPRAVKEITSILRVGDVARFLRIPGDAAQIGSRTTDPARAVEDDLAAPRDVARLDLWQEPEAEGALLSMENETGDVIAMIGGYDFERSEFNRAVQAERQPGSAFKPFIYGAALTRGFTPVSTLIDRPVVYTDPISGFVWAPRNYGRKFYGPMTMRDALKKSVNNATVHLFRDLGVRYVIDYARRFGIQAPLSSDLSLALGSSSMTLLELTRAYAVYPRGGTRVIPRFIRRVTDAEGHTLLGDVPLGEIPPPVLKTLAGPHDEPATESYPDSEILPTMQIITPADAYLMSDLLHAVVLEGTGRRLKALGRTVAGKTGTTNDFTDAWFMGFSPELTTGVWVGHDDNQVLGWGESGGKTALPIWGDFMRVALAPYPQRDFEVPAHIEFQRIDRRSGLIADANTTDAYFQPFLEGTAPERSFTEQTTTKKTRRAARDDIF